MRRPRADFDTPWKEALERYFEPFLAFFFPELHKDIDWQADVRFLEQELRQAVRVAGKGRHIVDKLAEVRLRSGQLARILIHVEIQSQKNEAFARRTFVCNVILHSRHDCPVISLVMLGDRVQGWRPREYGYGGWGSEVEMRFAPVKLLDWETRWPQLAASSSPFALLTMAQLRTQSTSGKPESRAEWKLRLLDWLYEHHRDKEEVFLDLFRFLDIMMALPEDLEDQFGLAAERKEEERRMPILSPFERRAVERGVQKGTIQTAREAVLDALEIRFEDVPEPVTERVREIGDPALLRQLHRTAIGAGSIEEFERAIAQAS